MAAKQQHTAVGTKPQPIGSKPQQPPRKQEDFDMELQGRRVSLQLANGEWVAGVVWERARFWLKLVVGGHYVYVNKSHIVRIEVVKDG